MLAFKDQKSADMVRRQLGGLGTKINQQLQPVHKQNDRWSTCTMYCSIWIHMWFVWCIGYTCRHLHQHVEEHKHSVIGTLHKHFTDTHDLTPDSLIKNLKVIKKCRGKLACLIYDLLWNQNKGPKLNTQVDSIHTKLFTEWILSC